MGYYLIDIIFSILILIGVLAIGKFWLEYSFSRNKKKKED